MSSSHDERRTHSTALRSMLAACSFKSGVRDDASHLGKYVDDLATGGHSRAALAIAVGQSYPPEELDTEFKKRYPPDQFGEEMAPNARVWKVYRDEASAQDEATLDGWNKTLDILLIFVRHFGPIMAMWLSGVTNTSSRLVFSRRLQRRSSLNRTSCFSRILTSIPPARCLHSCQLATGPGPQTCSSRFPTLPSSRSLGHPAGSMGCG